MKLKFDSIQMTCFHKFHDLAPMFPGQKSQSNQLSIIIKREVEN